MGGDRSGIENVTIKQIQALTEIASFDGGATSAQVSEFAARATLYTLRKKEMIEPVGRTQKGSPLNLWVLTDKGYQALYQIDKLYERAFELGI